MLGSKTRRLTQTVEAIAVELEAIPALAVEAWDIVYARAVAPTVLHQTFIYVYIAKKTF